MYNYTTSDNENHKLMVLCIRYHVEPKFITLILN